MPNERILVVDDNPVNLKLTTFLLSSLGYNVCGSATAEEGLRVVHSFRPHLVLTDIELPGISGLEFTRRIKAHPEWKTARVVALTALESAEDERRLREAGCEGYIRKPFQPAELFALLRVHLDAPVSPAAAAELSFEELGTQFREEGARSCRDLLAQMQPGGPATFSGHGELRGLLHRWAGLGGTLGYPEITSRAREGEALLQAPASENGGELRRTLAALLELFTAGA